MTDNKRCMTCKTTKGDLFCRECVRAFVINAKLEERERCAQIAEWLRWPFWGGFAALGISRAIRKEPE